MSLLRKALSMQSLKIFLWQLLPPCRRSALDYESRLITIYNQTYGSNITSSHVDPKPIWRLQKIWKEARHYVDIATDVTCCTEVRGTGREDRRDDDKC